MLALRKYPQWLDPQQFTQHPTVSKIVKQKVTNQLSTPIRYW